MPSSKNGIVAGVGFGYSCFDRSQSLKTLLHLCCKNDKTSIHVVFGHPHMFYFIAWYFSFSLAWHHLNFRRAIVSRVGDIKWALHHCPTSTSFWQTSELNNQSIINIHDQSFRFGREQSIKAVNKIQTVKIKMFVSPKSPSTHIISQLSSARYIIILFLGKDPRKIFAVSFYPINQFQSPGVWEFISSQTSL